MKPVTPGLIKFAITAIVSATLFRYFLTYGIEVKSGPVIVVSASVYALLMFLSGWSFGKEDKEYLPFYDVGFRFHLTTYLIHNAVSELWFALGASSKYENIASTHTVTLIWGIFLLVHFIVFLRSRKNAINNLHKEDLFD